MEYQDTSLQALNEYVLKKYILTVDFSQPPCYNIIEDSEVGFFKWGDNIY